MPELQIEQGSVEWYAARLGLPTASRFHEIITPVKGERSTDLTSKKYMCELIVERLLNRPATDSVKSEFMERGTFLQPHALQHFELETGLVLEPCGFFVTEDQRLGASPDGIVAGKPREAIEIKCLDARNHMYQILLGPEPKYKPQVQGQLLVGGFDVVHLCFYHPDMPFKHYRVEPDRGYLGKMIDALEAFCLDLDRYTAEAAVLGEYKRNERVLRPLDLAYPDRDRSGPLQSILDAG